MKILIVHLADIHVKSASDAILSHANSLIGAIASSSHGVGHIFIVLTGDVAYSGEASEYAAIRPFLLAVQSGLKAESRCQVAFVICPGNHDCNFRLDNATRRYLVAALSSADRPEVDESVIAECTKVQRDFFEFRDGLEQTTVQFDDGLWRTQFFSLGTVSIAFESLNISWVSQQSEIPGRLFFPVDRYAQMPRVEATIRISLLHQPFNWLSQNAYRPLRGLVRRVSDVVLTGHEHVGNVGITDDATSGRNVFVEGCVLQESGNTLEGSAFNIVEIEVGNSLFKSIRYQWGGSRYSPVEDGSWTNYRELPLRRDSLSVLHPDFMGTLDDIGGPIRHPGRQTVTLDDLFVYPDLLEFSDKPHQRLYKSSAFLATPETVGNGVLLEGDDKCGKTSLLRHLFRQHYDRGFYPVLLNARNFNKEDKRAVHRAIDAAIRSQYGDTRFEEVVQAPMEKRVALVDDLDDSKIQNSAARSTLLKNIRDRFSILIVTTGRSFELNQADAIHNQELLSLERLQIQPFGYALRARLIGRWHALGIDGTVDEAAVLARCDHSERIINYVMKRGLIPSAPLFLLTLLQSIEAGRSGEFKDSALGFYYQYLLTDAFVRSGVTAEKLTELFQYCSHLAWFFHTKGCDSLADVDLRVFNQEFSEEWTTVDFEKRLDVLVGAHVLCEEGGEYRFRYPYIYYYLKGKYLSERLKEQSYREYVQHCCEHLYVRDHAHTILFLAHHTSDPFVLQSIQSALASLFRAQAPVTFDGDTVAIAKIMDDVPKLTYRGGRPEDHRERMNRLRDQLESSHQDGLHDHEELTNELSLPARITSLIKTTEILGQVLKNQYSKISRKRKVELLDEVFAGPLRALKDFFGQIEASPDALVLAVETMLENLPQKPDEGSRGRIARRLAASIVLAWSYGFVARAAESANSENLAENVDQVVKKNGTTAYELIDIAIALDSARALPRAKLKKLALRVKDEPLGRRVLQLIVLNRLYMFRTLEKDLQWLASDLKLDIDRIHTIAYSRGRGRKLK